MQKRDTGNHDTEISRVLIFICCLGMCTDGKICSLLPHHPYTLKQVTPFQIPCRKGKVRGVKSRWKEFLKIDSILCPTPSLDIIDINVLVLGDTVTPVSQANCVWIAVHYAAMGGAS